MKATYTKILHDWRDALGLTNNEYMLCDIVKNLAKSSGWCDASQPFLGKKVGVSDRSIRTLTDKMISKGLLQKNSAGYLRATEKWLIVYTSNPEESSEQQSAHEEESSALTPEDSSALEEDTRKNLPLNPEESSDPPGRKFRSNPEESSDNNKIDNETYTKTYNEKNIHVELSSSTLETEKNEEQLKTKKNPSPQVAPAPSSEKDKIESDITEIISYLNEVCSRRFDTKTKSYRKLIRARLKEGNTKQECFDIIETMNYKWGDNLKMSDYLKPDTLFRPEKFPNYKELMLQAKANPILFKNKLSNANNSTRTNSRKNPQFTTPGFGKGVGDDDGFECQPFGFGSSIANS